jgi:hypothetical protein
MSERPSMWSLVQQATWLRAVHCINPQCATINIRGSKPEITIDECGQAWCAKCGATWEPHLPRPVAV